MIPGWRERLLVDPSEHRVLEQYGSARGAGQRCALVLVDFQQAYLGVDGPIARQLEEFPAGAGEGAWRALREALPVLHAARAARIPVIYTVVARPANGDVSFDAKRRRAADLSEGSPGTRVPDLIAPTAEDAYFTKPAASIFFETTVASHLEKQGIDTLFLAGLSTGGCVRASVVDAAARGINAIVIADAVADRLQLSHEAALVDIWMKYGDLAFARDAIAYFESLGTGAPGAQKEKE